MTEAVSRLDRITANPSICHGAPTIRGMRLRVQDVLELLASGMTYDEVLADYEELERDDILAVLEFAALDSSGAPTARRGVTSFLVDQQLPQALGLRPRRAR